MSAYHNHTMNCCCDIPPGDMPVEDADPTYLCPGCPEHYFFAAEYTGPDDLDPEGWATGESVRKVMAEDIADYPVDLWMTPSLATLIAMSAYQALLDAGYVVIPAKDARS